jgi:hypothetical protein
MFILALHFSDWSRCFRDKSAEKTANMLLAAPFEQIYSTRS